MQGNFYKQSLANDSSLSNFPFRISSELPNQFSPLLGLLYEGGYGVKLSINSRSLSFWRKNSFVLILSNSSGSSSLLNCLSINQLFSICISGCIGPLLFSTEGGFYWKLNWNYKGGLYTSGYLKLGSWYFWSNLLMKSGVRGGSIESCGCWRWRWLSISIEASSYWIGWVDLSSTN